jgi:uroporphyrinogen decarboxylase
LTSFVSQQLVDEVSRTTDRERFLNALRDSPVVVGSQLTQEKLASMDVHADHVLRQRMDWRELLTFLDKNYELSHANIALEVTGYHFGLLAGLEARGAKVIPIDLMDRSQAIDEQSADRYFALESPDESPSTHLFLLESAASASRFCDLVQRFSRQRLTNRLIEDHIVVSLGAQTTDFLIQNGIEIDLAVPTDDLTESLEQIAKRISKTKKRKQNLLMNMSGPASPSNDSNAPWYNSPFMKACRLEPTNVTPIWMMRQAGRYMKEYRAVRDKVSFLDLCANPQLCSEVMCTAVEKLGVDVAIIFSDLLPILVPMGCDLEFVKGDGPVIHNPIRTASDVDRIKPLESIDSLQFVMDTVKQTRADLPADIPLIGFAGAPFTLASYMIEGGGSRNYAHAKKMMHGDRSAWKVLMQRLTDSIVIYLQGQIDAGAQCVQLFDSWAGCLNTEDYRVHVHPFVKQIIERIPEEVPVINFATGNPALLPMLADTKAAVIGVDWRIGLNDAWQTIGHDRAVQGNLDPTVLLTNPEEIKRQAKSVLDQAAGRPGHIFNLGHGILPETPVENAIALVDAVHELSQR